jgi:hypothetical protein
MLWQARYAVGDQLASFAMLYIGIDVWFLRASSHRPAYFPRNTGLTFDP